MTVVGLGHATKKLHNDEYVLIHLKARSNDKFKGTMSIR